MSTEQRRVTCCFWCVKPLDSNVILNKEDQIVFNDYEPCDHCKNIFSHGIQIIGVSTNACIKGLIPMTEDEHHNPLYPTGTMFLAPEEFVRRLLCDKNDKEVLKLALEHRRLLMPEFIVEDMIKRIEKETQQEIPDLLKGAGINENS